jgi:hypothetical protein
MGENLCPESPRAHTVLTTYQRSLYLTVLNATMIARSLGKTFRRNERERNLKGYKRRTFEELEHLCSKMVDGTLRRGNIHQSIQSIQSDLSISFGQAQKALNVLLKCHYFLYYFGKPIADELDCPLDSVVLRSLGEKISLSTMDKPDYLRVQRRISAKAARRIDYDIQWDERHLREEGLL